MPYMCLETAKTNSLRAEVYLFLRLLPLWTSWHAPIWFKLCFGLKMFNSFLFDHKLEKVVKAKVYMSITLICSWTCFFRIRGNNYWIQSAFVIHSSSSQRVFLLRYDSCLYCILHHMYKGRSALPILSKWGLLSATEDRTSCWSDFSFYT